MADPQAPAQPPSMDELVAKLQPNQLAQLHSALYQLQQKPQSGFDPQKVNQLWGSVSKVITSKPLLDPSYRNLRIDPLAYSASYQQAHPQPAAPTGLLENAWQEVKGLFKGATSQPSATDFPLLEQPTQELAQPAISAVQAAAKGQYKEAAKQAVQAVPMVGPMAVARGEQLAKGQYRAAIGAGAVDLLALGSMAAGLDHEGATPPVEERVAAPSTPTPSAPVEAVRTAPKPTEVAPSPVPQAAGPVIASARHAEAEAAAARLGPEFNRDSAQHEVTRLQKAVAQTQEPEAKAIATKQLADAQEKLDQVTAPPTPIAKPEPPTTPITPAELQALKPAEPVKAVPIVKAAPAKMDLESTIRQAVTDPAGKGRVENIRANVQQIIAGPRDQALAAADAQDKAAFRASEQAKVIRDVLDKQDDVNKIRAKLGAWSTARNVQIDEDTGLPVKGSAGLEFENPATPAERDTYNQLLGRKLQASRAYDLQTGRVVRPPKVGSPEEAAQVDEFIKRLTDQRDGIVQQIKAGMPVTDEAVQQAAELNDQITELTGMRSRYAPGKRQVTGVAGKATPITDELGVVRPDPNAPLPELTQELYNGLMGRAADAKIKIKPELLERRIGQLNLEAGIRDKIAKQIRSAHGDTAGAERPAPMPVEVKQVAEAPQKVAPELKVAASNKLVGDALKEAAIGKEDAPKVDALPPRPPDEPGHFWAKQFDENGVQIGWKKIKLAGPGTPGVGQGPDNPNVVSQYVEALRANEGPPEPFKAKLIRAAGLGDAVATGKNIVTDAFNKGKAIIAGARSLFGNQAPYSDWERARNEWLGAKQAIAGDRRELVKADLAKHPDPLTQAGIKKWALAGGDTEKLQLWADASKGAFKKAYLKALNLTDDEKLTAMNLRNFEDDIWQTMHQAGKLDAYRENYLPQIWEKKGAEFATRNELNAYNGNSLRPDPSFARQRSIATEFEGEQRGFKPKSLSYVHARDHSFAEANNALIDGAFIKALHEAKAADGKPILMNGGAVIPLPGDVAKDLDPAYVVTSRANPGDAGEYKWMPHSVLRGIVYGTKDAEGKPILVKGDAYVHRDYAPQLEKLLSRSAIRSSAIGRGALAVSSGAKTLATAFSTFHQGTVDIIGLTYKLNPYNLPKVDVHDPLTRELLDHELNLYDMSGRPAMMEGLDASGGKLTKLIPFAGKALHKYSDWLFNEHIPAMKVAMAKAALERNISRYSSSMSRDQILQMTSRQANAAFGNINYRALGISPTVQDALSLSIFAHDFQLSRAQTLLQAVMPGGREQSAAVIRGALGFYLPMRIANMAANNGDPHYDQPFGLVLNGKVYSMRTYPGDILALVSDPRSFVNDRTNQVTTRTVMEAMSGRDWTGKRVNAKEQLEDLGKAVLPFAAQKKMQGGRASSWIDAALQSIGVKSGVYYTPAEQSLRQAYFNRTSPTPGNEALYKLRQLAEAHDPSFDKEADAAINAGTVSQAQLDSILDHADDPQIQYMAQRATLPELADAWKKASPDEKEVLGDVVAQKAKALDSDKMPDAQRQQYEHILDTEFK